MQPPLPVILDTDIGHDIDDAWALAQLLHSPELDLKMVLTDTGDTTYRAKIVAKMLEAARRSNIPIGIGLPFDDSERFVLDWVADYDLRRYPGTIHEDGVQAFVDYILASEETVTVIGIAPVPNLAAALEIEPRIVEKIRFVGMHGSFKRGYGNAPHPDAEANVRRHTRACQKWFSALKDITLAPLDTCDAVRLDGALYRQVRSCKDPLVQAVLEQYALWAKNVSWDFGADPEKSSSTLFDTVAVHLAHSHKYLVLEPLKMKITESGLTVEDPRGIPVQAALR